MWANLTSVECANSCYGNVGLPLNSKTTKACVYPNTSSLSRTLERGRSRPTRNSRCWLPLPPCAHRRQTHPSHPNSILPHVIGIRSFHECFVKVIMFSAHHYSTEELSCKQPGGTIHSLLTASLWLLAIMIFIQMLIVLEVHSTK